MRHANTHRLPGNITSSGSLGRSSSTPNLNTHQQLFPFIANSWFPEHRPRPSTISESASLITAVPPHARSRFVNTSFFSGLRSGPHRPWHSAHSWTTSTLTIDDSSGFTPAAEGFAVSRPLELKMDTARGPQPSVDSSRPPRHLLMPG
jgi:hypothetical protein